MGLHSTPNITNNSNTTKPGMSSFCVQNGLSASFKAFIVCLYVIIFLVGFCGNILVIYAIKFKQKTIKTFDFYIISLSAADLLSSVFVPIVAIQDLLLDFSDWILLGDFGCKVFVAIDHLAMLVSSFMLILISTERLRYVFFYILLFSFEVKFHAYACHICKSYDLQNIFNISFGVAKYYRLTEFIKK